MARLLRTKKHKNGLILANGGMLTHQHVLCLSAQPRSDGRAYPSRNPLPLILDESSPPFTESAEGPATIEVGYPLLECERIELRFANDRLFWSADIHH